MRPPRAVSLFILSDTGLTIVTVRESMPSNEPAGALPGEHSSGVGALPGTSAETGVAILPDERGESALITRPQLTVSRFDITSVP